MYSSLPSIPTSNMHTSFSASVATLVDPYFGPETAGWVSSVMLQVAVLYIYLGTDWWSRASVATEGRRMRVFVSAIMGLTVLHSIHDAVDLLCYHNSTWANYTDTLRTRQFLDTTAVVLIAIEGAVVQLVKASRTIKLLESPRDMIVFSAHTTVGIAMGMVGALGFAGWQMVGFGTPTSLDILIVWWIAGTLLVEMIGRIMIILSQHAQSSDSDDNEMLALLILTDIGLYTFAAVLLGLILMGGAMEGAVWTNPGAAFCQPIACYWALILIHTLDACPAEAIGEKQYLLGGEEKGRYTEIV